MSIQSLAAYATRHPRRVLSVWGVVVLVSLGLIGALLGGGLTSESKLTNHPESERAAQLKDVAEQGGEIVVVRNEALRADEPAFAAHIAPLGGAPVTSEDGHAVAIALTTDEEDIEGVIAQVHALDRGGFHASIAGEQTLERDFTVLSEEDLANGELKFGLPAALIVLLLVVGTLAGAAIPMAMAVISIVVALGLTALVGQVFELNLFITNMVVAMGLALGIDYSLFIVARLREERAAGADTRAAILTVSGTATRAVVFSGSAFVLAMSAMLLVPDTTLRSLGLGAVLVGLVSVVVALTFHPALLMVLGDRVERGRVPFVGRRETTVWARVVGAVLRRPALSLAAAVLVMLALATPVLGLQLGSAGASSLPDAAVAKQGLAALQQDFSAGATDPVEIVVDGPMTGADALRAELARDRDFAASSVTGNTISVPLTVEPSSERASAAIDRLRDEYVPRAFGATPAYVGGSPAEERDAFAVNARWLPIVIAFVLTLSFVLLLLAFRSLAIPLTAIAVNLLSVGAAYGVLVLVFQHGVGASLLGFTQVERVESWVPIFLFSVLFGLSMDYQVFLLSRIQERWAQTGDTAGAIAHGVTSTARLITGAAAIIVVVFSGFATGQLVAFQEMGFGMGAALALDATLVRLVLIPAAMALLGERNWALPRGLRRLPDLRVEGVSAG
ncbi:MMPL family transporter [Solirubrobacter phytolaccae]|uniref:MMPL family transporter n=1 Tax=Solirubrobacter phytolaccae TaxID=1404360 RepID=A0A9X3SA13_9ACTN|nr:MMPL family transporter [Solirubrobacter phytolaccae]MDA0182106.1 MMPL family transporter [Solirubrobacter phytolaccae]